MSGRLNNDLLKTAIANVLANEGKERKFVETIELQVSLKDFDPNKDKRIAGSVKLPHAPKGKYTFCVIGDAQLCDEATKLGIDSMTVEDMKKINKNKKTIRKIGHKYDAFIASQTLVAQIPRFLPGLNKMGKFPTPCTPQEKLSEKMEEIKMTLKFASKKDINLGFPVANVSMDAENIRQNALLSINFLIAQLKKNWSNVKTMIIKSTQGVPQRIYG